MARHKFTCTNCGKVEERYHNARKCSLCGDRVYPEKNWPEPLVMEGRYAPETINHYGGLECMTIGGKALIWEMDERFGFSHWSEPTVNVRVTVEALRPDHQEWLEHRAEGKPRRVVLIRHNNPT